MAAAAALLADIGAQPGWAGLAVIVVVTGALLAGLLYERSLAAVKQLGRERDSWRRALVNDRTAYFAHDLAGSLRIPLRDVAAFLSEQGLPADAAQVREAAAECERATAIQRQHPRTAALGDVTGGAVGFLGGVAQLAPSRSGTPLRHFSIDRNMPAWLGPVNRERLARVLRPIDLIRLLHTPQIERRSLIASLWIRAAIVLAAPLTSGLSPTGGVPLRPGASGLAEVVFWGVALESVAMALFANRVATYVMGRSIRWPLLVVEQTLAVGLILSAPCWACAAFAAGPIIWLEKKDWSLWKVAPWATLNLGALLIGAWGYPASDIIAELLISALVVALIADSYGLMLPAVAVALLRSWQDGRASDRAISASNHESRSTMQGALNRARAGLRHVDNVGLSGTAQARKAELLEALALADARVSHEKPDPRRHPRSLLGICAQSIAGAGVPPIGSGVAADLHATQISVHPRQLGSLRISTPKAGKTLGLLIRRLVFEACAHGEGVLSAEIVSDEAGVVVTLANGMRPHSTSGSGIGTPHLRRLESALPGARVVVEGQGEFNGMRMWIVRVKLEASCFQSRGRRGAAQRP